MIRGIIGLTGASALSRAVSAVSILLLAAWISPSGFGYWAAATSALSIATAFINFGEVNGYLSGHGTNFKATRSTIFRGNLLLSGISFAIAGVYLLAGNHEVALLASTIAVTVPLIGDSDLLYAAGVKHGRYRRVVVSQVSSALAKLVIGLGLAWWTESAIAIAVATAAYYVVVQLVLGTSVPRIAINAEPPASASPARRDRLKWTLNSVFQTLPVQIGFLVTQFVADPAVLGTFYLAYQATLAVSGVIVAPISRVTLATFARTESEGRARVAGRVASIVGALLLIGAGIVALIAPLASSALSTEWQGAIPAAVILLASLPIRIIGPILDAYQQSHDRWWQSTTFNVVDTLLTGFASLAALSGDVVLLASAVALAKMLLGTVRTIWVFADQSAALWGSLIVPLFVGGLAIVTAPLLGGAWSVALPIVALTIGLAWLAPVFRARGT